MLLWANRFKLEILEVLGNYFLARFSSLTKAQSLGQPTTRFPNITITLCTLFPSRSKSYTRLNETRRFQTVWKRWMYGRKQRLALKLQDANRKLISLCHTAKQLAALMSPDWQTLLTHTHTHNVELHSDRLAFINAFMHWHWWTHTETHTNEVSGTSKFFNNNNKYKDTLLQNSLRSPGGFGYPFCSHGVTTHHLFPLETTFHSLTQLIMCWCTC